MNVDRTTKNVAIIFIFSNLYLIFLVTEVRSDCLYIFTQPFLIKTFYNLPIFLLQVSIPNQLFIFTLIKPDKTCDNLNNLFQVFEPITQIN